MRKNLKNRVEATHKGEKNVIYSLLCEYYDGEIFKDVELDDISSEIYMRLEDRPSGIFEAFNLLMPLETNLNDETEWTPLMMSVMNLDYYMTEYLIENGANPCYWFAREEDIKEQEFLGMEVENYYLADIDIRIMDGMDCTSETVINNILNLARLILRFEGVNSFWGHCIVADKEKRKITIQPLEMMY